MSDNETTEELVVIRMKKIMHSYIENATGKQLNALLDCVEYKGMRPYHLQERSSFVKEKIDAAIKAFWHQRNAGG